MASNPCCCLTLKTGGFIISILAIVLSTLSLLVTSVTLTGLLVVKSIDNGTLLRNVSAEIHKNDPDINGANIDAAMSMLIILLSVAVVYSILNIIMGSVLIHGIRMERSSHLKVWIIYEICALVVFLVLHISLAFVQTSDGSSHSDLLTTCLSALLQIYFIYVVYRLHDEMRGGILPTSRPKY